MIPKTIFREFKSKHPLLSVHSLTLVLAFSLWIHAASAQTQTASIMPLPERITQELGLIHAAEQEHLPDVQLGYLWARLASDYRDKADFSRSEDAYNRSLRLLKAAPEAKADYATLLDKLGNLYLIYGHKDEAESCMKKSLAIRQELGNVTNIGLSHEHLAEVALARHKFKDAERAASEAYQILVTAKGSDTTGLAAVLVTLTYARCEQNKCAEGLQSAEQALSIVRTQYQPDSLHVGHTLMALGFAKWKMGGNQDAEKAMLQGIQIIRTLNAPGDPNTRYAFMEYRDYLKAMHRSLDVKQIEEQLATSTHQPCASCSVSVYSLSNAMR
jgi:tetratricopeptide (TPR) repeat protein